MEETTKKYYPLGQRTLWVLIFRKSAMLFFLAVLFIIGVVVLAYTPALYLHAAVNIMLVYIIFLVVVAAGTFFIGWLQYFRYAVFIDDKDLKIARGLIATEQIGIPYRRIKDIKIERSIVDQIFGVSDIIISTLGEEANNASLGDESLIFLPSLDQAIALQIQDVVLKKAQVEQVSVL
jgi:uncharacterized membrane protein YdbT with pleckstrin-like domain